MRRLQITTLTSNADAAALETARLALTGASGRAVLGGSQVTFTVEPGLAGEELLSGDMVGFAYVPLTLTADGLPVTRGWRRWAGGDFAIIPGPGMVRGPVDIPPGVERIVSLPLALVDTKSSGTSTTFPCGIFTHVPSTIG